MPALNFQARFAEAVASGAKLQTIRAHRKRPIKVGELLFLYTGMRTKGCRKLRTVLCRQVGGIVLHADGVELWPGTLRVFFMGANTKRRELLEHFAKRDGFSDWATMREWFAETHGLPFEGSLIEWDQ